MNRRSIILFALSISLAFRTLAAPTQQERADWSSFFATAEAHGTIVVVDNRNGKDAAASVYDAERAGRRYSPASTFKIPHSLFALDAGILRDEFQVIRWDGVQRSIEAWNGDQNLRSAMRNSTVWFTRDLPESLAMHVKLPTCETLHMATPLRQVRNLSGSKATWQFRQMNKYRSCAISMVMNCHSRSSINGSSRT